MAEFIILLALITIVTVIVAIQRLANHPTVIAEVRQEAPQEASMGESEIVNFDNVEEPETQRSWAYPHGRPISQPGQSWFTFQQDGMATEEVEEEAEEEEVAAPVQLDRSGEERVLRAIRAAGITATTTAADVRDDGSVREIIVLIERGTRIATLTVWIPPVNSPMDCDELIAVRNQAKQLLA